MESKCWLVTLLNNISTVKCQTIGQINLSKQQIQMRQLSPYLPRDAISTMNPEQIEFAKQQLHLLLSQQMSKVSMGLSKKEKVQNNLQELQRREQTIANYRIQKLNNKLMATEEKRKKTLEDKIAQCKKHDKKLQNKISEMQRRKNQEERQAARKSRTYSLDLLNYLKQKQIEQCQIQQKIKKDIEIKQKINSLNSADFQPQTPSLRSNHSAIKNRSKTNALDDNIKIHQKKAKIQHQQQMELTFQKILKKMDIMNQKKLKTLKERELKQTNKTAQSRTNRINDSYEFDDHRNKKQPKDNSHSRISNNKKTIDYIAIKRQKDQRQFEERGQIYNRMKEKDRKDDILRQLKIKVREQRMNLLNATK